MENITAHIQEMHRFFNTRQSYSLKGRLSFLNKLKQSILKSQNEICKALYADFKKPPFETYTTEIFMVLSELDEAIKHLKTWAKTKYLPTKLPLIGSFNAVTPEPYGVCLIFSPFNYPFQLALSPLIGAVAAGNCVVLKPSEYTPHTSKILQKLLKDVFPSHLVYCVEGEVTLANYLLKQPFDYIFFTGSTLVGKKVMKAASENLTPITLELGGKNPVIVDASCDLKRAAKRIVWGKFLNASQTCVAPDYVLVHENSAVSFLKALQEAIETLFSDKKDMARIINEAHYVRLLKCIDEDKIYYGGHFNTDDLYIEPTLLYPASLNDVCMQEEIFGPILPIIPFKKLSSAIEIIHRYPKPLACYIFSKDKLRIKHILKHVSFGGGCINDTVMHLVSPNVPFGGIGYSGMGAYHGVYSFQTFSHYKTILHSHFLEIPLRYPPYKRKLKLVKKYIPLKFK